MQRSSNISQRSLKKKRPLNIERISNLAFSLTILVVFLFTMSAFVKNMKAIQELKRENKILAENQMLITTLTKQLETSKTPGFIEHYARENLDMLKSGEFVILLKSK